jgi:hypothetical protein
VPGIIPENLRDFYIDSKSWIIVRSFTNFIDHIEKNGLPHFISLDLDLETHGQNSKNGYDAAKWLVNYCIAKNKLLPTYVIHSTNAVDKRKIESYLDNFKNY